MLKTIAAFDRIGEENAFAVLARANALAAQGRDIINLGIGQPGVERVLELLRTETYAMMQQVGAPSIKHLVPAMVRRA